MIKLKYQQLTDYLLEFLPQAYHGNFYSWIDQGDILNEGKTVTEQGEILFYLEYSATLYLHEFPYRQINPMQLMALLNDWINNDHERCVVDNYKTPFDLEIIDDQLADLSFNIDFREPIYLEQTQKTEENQPHFEKLVQGELKTEVEIWSGENTPTVGIYVNDLAIDTTEKAGD